MEKLQGEIEIPVWNFTQINQEWGQIAYFDYPISADSSPNTGPKNLSLDQLYMLSGSLQLCPEQPRVKLYIACY